MLRVRIIPTLLLRDESLVKTVNFNKFTYIGDPCNTVRIFNELEVDELLFLDISATTKGCAPNFKLLGEIANECFMPLAYGGGIRNFSDAQTIFKIGFEKVAINSYAVENPQFITQLSEHFGSQAVIVSIDVKYGMWGKPKVHTRSGKRDAHRDPVAWAKEAEARGAGEILLTSIRREGRWTGFDIDLLRSVSDAVSIPVIAHGGGGSLADIRAAVKQGGASAVALGSMVLFQKKDAGVLINFPDPRALRESLS